jgi:Flp pilus assembly pilin Flp
MSKAVTQRSLLQFWRCSKGITAIEYALIAGTIAAVLIFSVATVSKHLDNSFRNTATELSGMPGTGGGGGGGGTSDGGSDGGSGGDTADNDGGTGGGGSSNDDDNSGKGKGKGKGR